MLILRTKWINGPLAWKREGHFSQLSGQISQRSCARPENHKDFKNFKSNAIVWFYIHPKIIYTGDFSTKENIKIITWEILRLCFRDFPQFSPFGLYRLAEMMFNEQWNLTGMTPSRKTTLSGKTIFQVMKNSIFHWIPCKLSLCGKTTWLDRPLFIDIKPGRFRQVSLYFRKEKCNTGNTTVSDVLDSLRRLTSAGQTFLCWLQIWLYDTVKCEMNMEINTCLELNRGPCCHLALHYKGRWSIVWDAAPPPTAAQNIGKMGVTIFHTPILYSKTWTYCMMWDEHRKFQALDRSQHLSVHVWSPYTHTQGHLTSLLCSSVHTAWNCWTISKLNTTAFQPKAWSWATMRFVAILNSFLPTFETIRSLYINLL